MLPSERNKEFRDFLIKMSRFHGSHSVDKSQVTPRIMIMVFLSSICVVMQLNGLYHIWPDFMRICHSMMLEPIELQLLTRIAVRFLNNDEELVSKIHDTIDKFYKNEEKNLEYLKILTSRVKLIEFLSKLYMLLNFICFMIPPISALIISWISSEFIMLVPFWLPFTDPTETFGFVLNSALMMFYTIMFCEILISQDLFIIHYTIQVIPMGDIYIEKLKKLGKKLTKCRKNQKILINSKHETFDEFKLICQSLSIHENFIKQIEIEINDLIKSFNNYNNFIALIFPYMHYTTFIEISTNSIGIGLAIIVATFISAPIGISIILIFSIQVLMSCIQGTIISHQNQKILDEVWNFPWYKMSVSMQKVWLQFMHQCHKVFK
ncbi:uncharacterized protein [Chironomus tepperi]|uniref:uncharacterized protein n=1 Tax=Chironomus tepperi TaxID=113505 RepID=UPI00391F8456